MNSRRHITRLFNSVLFLACASAQWCMGDILFDVERNAIRIRDYPPRWSCTLPQLAAADRAFGWGRIRYDDETATCYIEGDLIIGANDGTETILQIGTEDRPTETLIMRGNIYVHPYFIADQNEGVYWRAEKRMNALRLGAPGASNINAALKFACASNEYYTLYVGRMPWIKNSQYGGGMYVYHGEISALNPAHPIGDKQHGWMHLHGCAVLDGARIADVKGFLYGLQQAGVNKDYLLRDTTFERVGTALLGGIHTASGCRFVDCGTAVRDHGGLKAELINCVFQGNDRNWTLTLSDDGLVLIDCEWDTPRKGDLHRVHVHPAGKKQYPKLSVQRHVVVEVRDGTGAPVKDAAVSFRPEQEGCTLVRGIIYKTGVDGQTPGRDRRGTILLPEYIQTAADEPETPEKVSFTYTMTVEKDGKQAVATGIRPDVSWKRIEIILGN